MKSGDAVVFWVQLTEHTLRSISPPVADEDHPPFVYINRKGKHSINVMLICDSNCEIIGCSARFPGSVHDAAIWQMSSIRRFLKQNYEDGDQQTHLIGKFI
ncbi:hypothetical protein DMN91_004024 [Ooceraea biroi]|uniref:DDE Tnp4 domain-containing protein n=1 Tax=Ooceraea biroi TaxID=2015173 RepID=A0A3L8DU34_OOCBI|nr:putative nuclease HARBI1 [Ooceraea biroi]RLU23816.1 hypothetical protein DMN91_004024 [Ooceraea biroi]